MALNRKIAYINLSNGEIETAPIPLEMRKLYLGGRGMDMYLLYNHTKKGLGSTWSSGRSSSTPSPRRISPSSRREIAREYSPSPNNTSQ